MIRSVQRGDRGVVDGIKKRAEGVQWRTNGRYSVTAAHTLLAAELIVALF